MSIRRTYNDLYTSPRCGDMWLIGNKYLLVDYVDRFVGITYDNGIRIGFGERKHFEDYLKQHEAANIGRWEDGWFTDCDDIGWSTGREPISKEQSAKYIMDQLMSVGID